LENEQICFNSRAVVVMIILLITISVIVAGAVVFCFTARIIFRALYRDNKSTLSVTVLGCGMIYDILENRFALVILGCKKYLKGLPRRKPARKVKRARRKAGQLLKKGLRKLPFRVYAGIGRAMLLYLGRFLSRLHYEEARLAARPVFVDPALAGMTYGLSAAVYGLFPKLQGTVDIYPDFAARKTRWTGSITISIRIREIVYINYRLLRDLPIRKIIGHWMSRGG
jgi:hypothetical protein